MNWVGSWYLAASIYVTVRQDLLQSVAIEQNNSILLSSDRY
ncbi:hypothetical protein [Oculatella sp. LEGE 06141]|nr:hypothetical protein [Oculatella sp. LEGE 06141]